MPYQDFAKFNLYELGEKTACDTIVDDLLGHMTTPVNAATSTATVNVGSSLAYVFDLADAASGNYDLPMPVGQSFKVTGMTAVKTDAATGGAHANTVTVMNGANVITGTATFSSKADKDVIHAVTIDDAHATIAGGGTLRVAVARAAGNAACEVYVYGVLIA